MDHGHTDGRSKNKRPHKSGPSLVEIQREMDVCQKLDHEWEIESNLHQKWEQDHSPSRCTDKLMMWITRSLGDPKRKV